MAKTKAPTGLSITRDGNNFICSWKKGDSSYDGGQRFWYRLDEGTYTNWVELSVSENDTSKTVVISNIYNKYYPNTSKKFVGIQFCVRGKRSGYDWSSDTYLYQTINKPNTPTVSSILVNTNGFKATFSTDARDDSRNIFTKFEWQSILVNESDETNGGVLNWASGQDGWQTGTMSRDTYSVSITEDTSVISYGSHTRWFRVRAQGPAGDTNWAYTKHVYASPSKAVILGVDAKKHSSGFILDATWKATALPSRPIDNVSLQYAKAVPIADMQVPANPSWQNAVTALDTSGNDSASVNISGLLEDDQCLFVRVATEHDGRYTYSDVELVSIGELATPSGLNVTVNNNTTRVQATNNSNASTYSGSDINIKRNFLAVTYKSSVRYKSGIIVGVIPKSASYANVTIPARTNNEEYSIEVQAVVGTYRSIVNEEGVSVYTVFADMTSDSISTEGDTPKAPEDVNVEVLNGSDIRVTWSWSWDSAEGIEISWSQDNMAWYSSAQPETFKVNGYTLDWYIKGLETGKRYYLKARFVSGDDYSPYSKAVTFIMSTEPVQPTIVLSASSIAKDGSVVVSWNYTPTDGSEQEYAEVVCNDVIIGHSLSQKFITIYANEVGWAEGTYGLTLRVKASSGLFSEYSDTVYVTVVPEITASIGNTSLEDITLTEDGVQRTVTALTELPLTVSINGTNTSNITSVSIVRAESFESISPDETLYQGFEDEIVYFGYGNGNFTIDKNDLIGELNDGAKYKIIATVQDNIGQIATDEKSFEVHWSHQASIPTGSVSIEGLTAFIIPQSSNAINGDVCDIYRLSADKPELIFSNGEFGSTYIDPYPALGGGYRIVFKTANDDYITEDDTPAWFDVESGFEYGKAIIDFGEDRVELYYNVDTNHSWEKDFTETKYLGGSVQGDWTPIVSRSGSVSAVVLHDMEEGTAKALRRLAEYSGICNVRTLDGSSFHANVNVSESRPHDRYGKISEFTLNITRVDAISPDGIPLGGL